jgi:hypothetical protein
MSSSTSFARSFRKLCMIGIATLIVAMNSFAGDSERITQLEIEVQELKTRLSKLESSQVASSAVQKPLASSEGWKNVSNWRTLKTGMSPDQVRQILGEPKKVDGGALADWFYPNGGAVRFYKDRLSNWSEP